MRYFGVIILCLGETFSANGQIIGDEVFAENQVVTIELTFNQSGFWDSLVANYTTSTYMAADVKITDNSGVYNFDSIGIRLKGNSSYTYPGNKKSFKIDFNKYINSQNYHELKKLNFGNAFHDPTFMHEKIMNDMCRAMDLPAPRTNYANVYMNGTHWGFYILIEQVDDQFLDWQFDDDDGNLFKAGDAFGGSDGVANLLWYDSEPETYYPRYELESNEDENNWNDLLSLIDFLNNTSDSVFIDSLENYFDLQPLLTSLALDNLFSNLDSYIYSGRNYYIYHNQEKNIWQWIKWDCNEVFGSYSGGLGDIDLTQLEINFTTVNRPLALRIFGNPELYSQYQNALCEIYNAEFTEESINDRINTLYNLIQPYVYADGGKMYSNTQFETNLDDDIIISGPMPGSTQTIYGLRSFVSERRSAVASQLDCNATNIDGESFVKETLILFPNPAYDYLQVLNAPDNTVVTISNLFGERVLQIMNNHNSIIDIRKLPAGFYLLEIENGNSAVFIKQ